MKKNKKFKRKFIPITTLPEYIEEHPGIIDQIAKEATAFELETTNLIPMDEAKIERDNSSLDYDLNAE